jgi:error-prone DNA polymerase
VFAELRCKSNFSFLRGASDAREYIQRAEEIGLSAVAITDVNGVYGLPRAYEVLKHHPSVKLICGAELSIADSPPVTLLARDRAAYGLLCGLLTAAHADKEKGAACLSWSELEAGMGSHPGRGGLVALPELDQTLNFELCSALFPGRTYLPLCRYIDGMDEERTALARDISERFGLPIVATNDVHYHVPARRPLQDCLTCVREGKTLASAGFHLFGNDERYLKSALQMRALFRDMPEAVARTMEIAESCTFSLGELKYQYPKEFVPAGHSSQSFLAESVFREAARIYRGVLSERVDAQIRHELRLIEKLNYADYFLTLYDIVKFAQSRDIACQGRGSAANSVICYVLGITSIDPVKANLLFERFISEERAEPPDIDVDFEHERREEVIQYIYERYGRDRAAMVSAVRTYQRKSAFLEITKAMGADVGTVSADVLARDFSERGGALQEKLPLVEKMIDELKGFPRHLSIHSGGFVLSDVPMTEIVPIEPARMEGRTIVQWDKNDLETLGLMKVDILALGFLTALNKISKMTGLDWRDIPMEDKATYQMIQRAETEGTFQIESRAQKAMLVRTHPENFYDLVVQVAIVRPGPNVGEMIHPYIQRREAAKRGIKYHIADPAIREALERTYGVPIFQEQIMKIAITKAGFNPGEADQLRRALAGWRDAAKVDDMSQRLYDRLLEGGVSEEYAKELFGYMKGYAHYGFPESHAASFASISYKSAYYKRHYPGPFLCGLINSQPMGFYPIDSLINEAKRQGVVVRPIDPNLSGWDAVLEADGAVRMGFRNVRGIREMDVALMVEERSARRFESLKDFVTRTTFSRDVIEGMALGDVFATFGVDQRHGFWKSLEFGAMFSSRGSGGGTGAGAGSGSRGRGSRAVDARQGFLFQGAGEEAREKPIFAGMRLVEEISADYRTLSYSLRGNIMKGIRLEDPTIPELTSTQVKKMHKGQRLRYAGVLTVIQRPPTAKGVAFITLEDENGSVDVVVRKEVYEEYRFVIQGSRFLILEGAIQRHGTGVSVLAYSFDSFGAASKGRPNRPGETGRVPQGMEWSAPGGGMASVRKDGGSARGPGLPE